jgi:hypothetical protein
MDDILKRNSKFKNTHEGKRCFIIGNGPSLNTQDIKPLKEEVTIVVNSFFRHPDAKIVHPKYWILADPLIWQKPEIHLSSKLKFFLEKEIDVKLFVPKNGYDCFSKSNNPLLDLYYYQYDDNKTIDVPIDFSTTIPPLLQNVVIVSLMLAFYLGCNPIYLIGCDHDSYIQTKEEFNTKSSKHFYENPTNYKDSDNMTWEHWSYCVGIMKLQFEQLVKYAKNNKIDVYNSTNGGYLNYFPRMEYNLLFKEYGW